MNDEPLVRVRDYAEYGEGRSGWIIETIHSYDVDGAPMYALPAWDERGWSELSGPFLTRESAQAVLSASGLA